jgi:hypothetical protein
VPALAAFVVLAVAALFLITWVRPAPVLEFVPAWASGTRVGPAPPAPVPWGARDLLAFMTPARNPFARALGTEPNREPAAALDTLETREGDSTLVVYVCSRAVLGPSGPKGQPPAVWLLPDDARGDAGVGADRVRVDDVIGRLSKRGPRHRLLVLDLHPAPGDPRLGDLGGDLATAVRDLVEHQLADPPTVLTSCDAGQEPLWSETLGRSVFSYYLEEGLRGWADTAEPGGAPDGRVTVQELAAYVRARVDRWARRNRGVRQTPALHPLDGGDFPVVVLGRSGPAPHLALPDIKDRPTYPAWLLDGWKLRDRWRAEGIDRDAPRIVAVLEATLLAAERDWRGGADPDRLRAALADAIRRLRDRLGPVRTFPHPRPVSIALAEALGQAPDGALNDAVKALLTKRGTPPPDQKPAETEAADAKWIAEFFAGLKPTDDLDLSLGAAAFRVAADDPEPKRDTLVFLDRLLRTRQPRPLYVETLALQRLAALPERAWRPPTVRLALDVVRLGERAASRPRSSWWVSSELNSTARVRHDGESLLLSPGFAPLDEAERQLRQARAGLVDLFGAEDAVEDVRRLADETLSVLPDYLPLVDREPGLRTAWSDAVVAVGEAFRRLELPPPGTALESPLRVDRLRDSAANLRASLDALRRPFAADQVAALTAAAVPVTTETYQKIDAILATPFPAADRRAALWGSLLSVDRRLNEQVLEADRAEGRTLREVPADSPADVERAQKLAAVGLERRKGWVLALLALVGVEAKSTEVSTTWADLPRRGRAATDPVLADRLGRLAPPQLPSPWLDDPETNPTRRLRAAEFRSLRATLAVLYADEALDLGGSPFFEGAAEEYNETGRPLPTHWVEVRAPTEGLELDHTHPVVTVPLQVRAQTRTAGNEPGESRTAVDVLTADADWLEVRRGSPWPSDRSPFPAVASSPLAFPLILSSQEPVVVPLEVRLRAEAEKTATPVPLGVLVRVDGGRYHRRVPITVVPASRRLRITLTADPGRPRAPLAELRLRPVRQPSAYSLFVENPSEADKPVVVQLLDGGAPVPGCEVSVTVKARSYEKVVFGQPSAKPEADAADFGGPLGVRVLDASDPQKVLAERTFAVGVAPPTDFVRVAESRYEPPGPGNDGKARLSFGVRAVAPVVGPPVVVEMALAPGRVPGLLAPGEGTSRAELAKEGDEALLFAEGLRLDDRDDDTGFVDLNVDGAERALVFRTTFARQGEPTAPWLDGRPAVRLRAPRAVNSVAPLEVRVDLDNPPQSGRLEVTLGRYVAGAFQADIRRELPATRESVRLNPRGPGGSLRFEAAVRDPVVPLDVRQIRGRRELRARVLNAEGVEVARDALAVVFDDRAPAGVKLVDVPRFALKGAPLVLRASGAAPGAGVRRVAFFAGRPADGKLPPNAAPVEARPLDLGRTLWTARLPVPDTLKGPLDVSVVFESGVGLAAFDTATVEVVDAIPPVPGRVAGKVVEGTRPQAGLDLVLVDAKGAEKGRAKTADDGTFEFAGLPAGAYRVVCVKPTPPTRGEADVTVAAGSTAEVTVEMLRTRR